MHNYFDKKQSGIKWIGEIPKDWGLQKLKYFFRYKKGSMGQKLTSTYLYENKGSYPVYSGQTENKGVLGFWSEYEFEFNEEVIFCTTVGAKLMTNRLIKGKFSLSQNCLILIPKSSDLDIHYLNYFISFDFKYRKELLPCIIQPSLRMEHLDKFYLLIPSLKEQKLISRYLNKKIQKIDSVIEKIEEKILLLNEQKKALINQYFTKGSDPNVQMKDNKVERNGKIPKSWSKIKIKYLTEDHRQGFYTSDPYDEEGIPILRITDINEQNKFDIKNSPKYNREHSEIEDFYLQKGDFLFPRTGGVGRFGIIDFDDLCIYGSFLIRFRFNDNFVSKKFMKFYFLSEFFKLQIRSEMHGGVNQNVHVENIKNCFLFLPNKEEQNYITEKLVGIESKINKLVKSYQSKLDLYKEYRQSLISSVVTGKIQITDDMI